MKARLSIILLQMAKFVDVRGDQLAEFLVNKAIDLTDVDEGENEGEDFDEGVVKVFNERS